MRRVRVAVRDPRRYLSRPSRAGIWVLLVGAVGAAVALGSGSGGGNAASVTATSARPAGLVPATAPPGALSSSWYCAGATGPGGSAPASMVLGTVGSREVRGEVTVVSTGGPARTEAVDLAPRSMLTVPESALASGPYVAATAVLYGGQVAAWQILSGPAGPETLACSSSGSKQWYEASGSTAGSDQIELALYNPFAADAVADLSFATTHGEAQPGDFQGIVVPARRLVVVSVGQHVQQQPAVATLVSARFGQLVVDQLSASGTGQGATATVTLGVAGTARRWYFPAGQSTGSAGSYRILNPSGRVARVKVSMSLASGTVAPFGLTVPGVSTASLATSGRAFPPSGVVYSVSVNATNGAGVVAERTEAASPGVLTSSLLGAPRTARTWLLTSAPASRLVLQNPGAARAVASVASVSGGRTRLLAGLARVEVPANRATTISLPSASRGVIVVQATRGLVVEGVTSASGRALPTMAVVGSSS